MKRVLIIQTGGTFAMVPRGPSGALGPAVAPAEWFERLPECRDIAEVTFCQVADVDSSNLGIAQWRAIAREVADNLDAFDGFVVIHGTDTMVYSAAALSFMLANLDRPVVLTGSQRPLASIRSDARSNLVSALDLATRDIPEVGVFFGTRLFRGNRARKVSVHGFEAFESPNSPALADVGLEVQVHHERIRRPQGLFRVHDRFDPRVIVLRVTPGTEPALFESLIASDVRAFVLEAFGAGHVPTLEGSWLPFVDRATSAGKVVAIATQAHAGAVDLGLYACGQMLERAGAVGCGDMTVEAATVKLMHLWGELGDADRVRRNLRVPLAGELSCHGVSA
ncbi:MAG: asparaginase [bacterium]|nr:asparaginase [bacterium]